ncbi:MAG: DNA-binding response regulator [Euryarchaeota archaeon]|nr:DNA-binding response regulator [Euryarchaeota archaeon]
MPTRCLVAASDLMAWSRIANIVRAAGMEPVQVRKAEALGDPAEDVGAIVVDLGDPAGGVAAVARARSAHPGARIVAVGPHVHTDLMSGAKEAGADATLPNSAVADRLGALLTTPRR